MLSGEQRQLWLCLNNHLCLFFFQYFLSKNAQFRGEIPTVVSFGTRLNGKHSASFGRWATQEPGTVFELIH